MTDAISFNVLSRGQLEYIRDNSNFDITLICGGSPEQLDILRERNIGRVVNARFQRKPSLLKDVESLTFLTYYLLFNRFDVIIYSTPKALLLGSVASFFSMQNRRVAVVQGRVYENYKGLKKQVFQNFDRLSFSVSHNVVFVSESLAEVCKKEKIIDNKKAEVINKGSFNGVDTKLFKPVNLKKKYDLREKFGIPLESYVVCIVGRICEDKGIKDISFLVEELYNKNIKFVFVGKFEDEIAKNIVETIVENNQGYYISHTSDIHEVFQFSDLHLFLSYREGFGNVAIEAASCGIPTFAYDVVGVKDSVNENISGRKFEFKDISSVTKALNEASRDTHFNEKYKYARDWVFENYNRKRVWQSYLNFYLKKNNTRFL